MFRFLLLVGALALYGAYSLFSHSPGPEPAPTVADRPAVTAPADTSSFVADVASSLTGFQFLPLPDQGCSPSALPPDRARALVESLPLAQQVALAKLLNASSAVWTVQLYTGELGTGLCLPVQEKLVLMPAAANSATQGLAGFAQSITEGFTK
ncbi:hypothetical protein [Burkholderia ambifaria]|uniref:hypothetical protein n=1 Tax=Burkholderia ambifaria TaxID=152480 RepID=UPI000F7FAEEE|nr:hypothetical protein [Burkholderia ambifaria]